MRKKIIIGNWKMNKTSSETKEFLSEVLPLIKKNSNVVFCVPYTSLNVASILLKDTGLNLGAQNMSWEESGAYTGEISASMLKEFDVNHVLLGHSERRQYFGETDATVNTKIKTSLQHNIVPVVCVGESLQDRKAGLAIDVVTNQLRHAFEGVDADKTKDIIVAYEPIWAIGTGVSASASDAQEMLQSVRNAISMIYNLNVADNMQLLYGGSANAANAAELLSQTDIDGLLVGGASLKSQDFAKMIEVIV